MILTLAPPTVGLKNKPSGKNGSNGMGFAFYWRGHPYAAGIAAQEVREARYKAVFAFPFAGTTTAAYVFLTLRYDWYLEAIPLFLLGSLLVVALVMKAPSLGRRIELLGQSVECVVRERYYGTLLVTSITEAARQLSNYEQFKGWTVSKIETALLKEIPRARKWAASNRKLIERAKESV